jgi:hypothetical protein
MPHIYVCIVVLSATVNVFTTDSLSWGVPRIVVQASAYAETRR